MTDRLRHELERALGVPVDRLEQLSGGDINDAFAVWLADGQKLFVKTRDEVPPGMYEREAEGLCFLGEAQGVRVPAVRHASERLLVLEFIASARRVPDFDERLGRALASLHRTRAEGFGLARDNYVGSLLQHNDARDSWVPFYREQRLSPLITQASQRGLLPVQLRRDLDTLLARLDDLVGPEEPPARLHGDLWSGNVIADERGAPVLVDPAVYGGQREIDLAMLQLFGAPSARFFAAYDELYPRAPGASERVALYQLYPLLVHVCLFGASYTSQLAAAVARYR